MPFVSVTRLRVKSIFFLIPFMRANEASVKELKAAVGLLKGKELIDKKISFIETHLRAILILCGIAYGLISGIQLLSIQIQKKIFKRIERVNSYIQVHAVTLAILALVFYLSI